MGKLEDPLLSCLEDELTRTGTGGCWWCNRPGGVGNLGLWFLSSHNALPQVPRLRLFSKIRKGGVAEVHDDQSVPVFESIEVACEEPGLGVVGCRLATSGEKTDFAPTSDELPARFSAMPCRRVQFS